MGCWIGFPVPAGCIPPKTGVRMSSVKVWWSDAGCWVSLSSTEDSIRESLLKTEETRQAMDYLDIDCIDEEVEQGLAHFVCDICGIAYCYIESGFVWHEMVSEQGIYKHGLRYACKTCLEELGYE